MRLINIEDYKPDTMLLGRPIYDQHKRILLQAGRSIHIKLLERIKQMKISYLFVEDAVSKGITLDQMLDMPTWIDAIKVLESVFKDQKKAFLINSTRELQQLVTKLILETQNRPALMLIPSSSIPKENKLHGHSINVALLGLQMGKQLSYNYSQLKDLALGCLLHDIGKSVVNDETHTEKGFELLKRTREISLLSAHIAFQHHETIDGEGFPRGIQQVHDYAQICGVANYYENLISVDQVLPHEAVERLMTKSDIKYSQKIIQSFIQSVPSYFPGTKVDLTNGKQAIVTKVDIDLHRPTIRYLDTGEEFSLVDHPSILIKGVI